jgi:hypothetical protein
MSFGQRWTYYINQMVAITSSTKYFIKSDFWLSKFDPIIPNDNNVCDHIKQIPL